MAKPKEEHKTNGRPPVIIEDHQMDGIEKLAATLSIDQLADFLGISRALFYTIRQRQPEVSRRYKLGRAKVIDGMAKSIISQGQEGNIAAAIFYLKTQAGWSEAKDPTDLISSDGSMSPAAVNSKEDIEAAIRAAGFDPEKMKLDN